MVYAQERDREDVKHKRELWTAKQPHTNCNSLVFLDFTVLESAGWGHDLQLFPRCNDGRYFPELGAGAVGSSSAGR